MICYLLAVKKCPVDIHMVSIKGLCISEPVRSYSFGAFFPWNKTPEHQLQSWNLGLRFQHSAIAKKTTSKYPKCNSWANNIAYLDMRIYKHVWDLGTVFIPNSAFRPWFTHQTPFPQQPHRSLSSHCWLGNKKVYKTAARLPATLKYRVVDMYIPRYAFSPTALICTVGVYFMLSCVVCMIIWSNQFFLRPSPKPQWFCLCHGHC